MSPRVSRPAFPFMNFSFTSILGAVLLTATAALAQETTATPPPAKVLGPQSVVEKYDAPVVKPTSTEGLIDFPSLIAAPGENDGMPITPSLNGLTLDILGTEGSDGAGEFIAITGTSRTGEKQPALYAALRAALAKYRAQALTLGDVRLIRQAITETYANQGFPLMSVVVPPQEVVDGRLRVQINEFNLASYSLMFGDGNGGYSADAPHWTNQARVQALLAPLLAEPILTRESLDKKVKYLNANPFRSARVVFEPGETRGESKAIFQFDEKRPWRIQTAYNNHATKASGTNRYSLGGSFGRLPFENHQVSWNAVVGDRIEEFQNYSLIYTAPNRLGHTLTANVNFSDTASSSIPGVDSASTTLQSTLSYTMPLIARDTFGWELNPTFALKQFERDSIFGGINVGGAQFDSAQVTLNSTFNWKETHATNQIVFTTVLSLKGLTGRNTDANFQAFYNRATGSAATQHFVLNYARVQQLKPLAAALDGWSTETQLSWQFTRDSLGGGDNFSLGGPGVLRAYQASEVNGDDGIYAVQFLHAKPLSGAALGALGKVIQQVNLSAFVEAGEVRFKTGDRESVWDYGVQASVSAKGGMSVSASLAFAGKATAISARGEARFFLSAQLAY